MSKGNMLQGQARGKVGDLVFTVNKGTQVTRVYNSQPANPRSKSQMNQRVKLGAAVGFYKRTKNFFKFAFKKTQKQSDYNAFIKENINISPYIRKDEVLTNIIVPAPYQMTRGDLNLDQTMNIDLAEDFTVAYFTSNYGGTSMSITELMEKMGAQIGDMITIYSVQSLGADNKPGEFIDRSWGKYTFKAADIAKSLSVVEFDEVYNVSSSNMFVNNRLGLASKITVPGASETTFCCGACIVLSRKQVGGSLQVSTSKLFLNDLATTIYDNYTSNDWLVAARNSYGASEDAFLVPEQPSEHA